MIKINSYPVRECRPFLWRMSFEGHSALSCIDHSLLEWIGEFLHLETILFQTSLCLLLPFPITIKKKKDLWRDVQKQSFFNPLYRKMFFLLHIFVFDLQMIDRFNMKWNCQSYTLLHCLTITHNHPFCPLNVLIC